MIRIIAVPGSRVEVEVDPGAWPYYIRVGEDETPAMPNKTTDNRGRIKATAFRTVPDLEKGQYPLYVRDRNGIRQVGHLSIA